MIVTDLDILHKKSEPVESISEAKELLVKLENELKLHNNGIGLSAVQIGIHKQIAIIKYKNQDTITIINPVIREQHDEFLNINEGCLSLSGKLINTKRWKHYIIDNTVIDDNDKFRIETQYFYFSEEDSNNTTQLESIAVQHEIDHMSGLTILDKEGEIPRKIGRNEKCPCGSNKKYKKCCLIK